jgi:nicotinamidase-related amidase
MQDKTNLVLIDFQDTFLRCIADTIDKEEMHDILHYCTEEIKDAVKNKHNILIVEFNHYGPTHHKLMECIPENYQKAHVIIKEKQDGSEQILDCCRKHRISKNTFRVCGIYLSDCVFATVDGVLKQTAPNHPEIQILSKCSAHPRKEMRKFYNHFKNEFETLSANVCFI